MCTWKQSLFILCRPWGRPTYCCFNGGVGYLGYQAVSELDPWVFGGDGQTFLQDFHQADPELKHSLWVFLVEPQVVDLLGHSPNPKDALAPVIDLELHVLQGQNPGQKQEMHVSALPAVPGSSCAGWGSR